MTLFVAKMEDNEVFAVEAADMFEARALANEENRSGILRIDMMAAKAGSVVDVEAITSGW